MVMSFRSKMLSLPSKVSLLLASKDDPKVIEALLERDISQALIELQNMILLCSLMKIVMRK